MATIFRTIDVGNGVTATLAAPASTELRNLAESSTSNPLVLKQGTFGRATSVQIYLAANGNIEVMRFGYDETSTPYGVLVSEFTTELGPPTSPGKQNTTWEDAQTTFTVSTDTNLHSILKDGGTGPV